MIESAVNGLAILGSAWVLWLLVFLSISSVAVMIERLVFYTRRRVDARALVDRMLPLLEKGDLTGAKALVASDSMEAEVVRRGLDNFHRGANTVRELMAGELIRQRARFESRLIFLGTLGNNAPFVGLFGTVLGIMRAFRDLSVMDGAKSGGNAAAVMGGISEALVATAVGLAVALPAVVAFNYFKSVVKGAVANTEILTRAVTTALPDTGTAATGKG